MSHSQPQPFMFTDDISAAFRARGWVRGAGGDLYYNGRNSSDHPHLHLRINGRNTVREGRDIRLAVTMLAWSDGMQGAGGGGRTYIRDATVIDPNWRQNQPPVNYVAAAREFGWIMDYFTTG